MTDRIESDTLGKIGVGSRADWLQSGLSKRGFYALIAAGELVRVRHGAYAARSIIDQAADDPGLRHAIEVAAARGLRSGTGTASHHSAALIRGLRLFHEPPAGTVTLTVPPGTRDGKYRTATGVICHIAELPAKHVMERHGVPLTTAARAVVDIARTSPVTDGVVVADSALEERRASKTEMRRVLADCAGWPGVGKARKVVEFADSRSESVLESCARVRFDELGLEPPDLQVAIRDANGTRIARADFCWPARHVVAEADGMLKYKEDSDLVRKYKRDERLLEAGWEVVHFTWAQLFSDAGQVVGRIRAAFGRAARLRRR